MHITDQVYGDVEITEPVLIELLCCATLQRLKGVDMGGHASPWINAPSVSRYTHSVGVMLLLRRFGASLNEQIAGLLHDISHTAFSHSIDYALNKHKQETQDYQDSLYVKRLFESEIPSILKKHSLHVTDFKDLEQYLLLETELPELCADRIDYSLRHMLQYAPIDSRFSEKNIKMYLVSLSAKNGKWYFTDTQIAYRYTKDFAHLSDNYFAGEWSAKMFATTGDCIAYAVAAGYLTHDSLCATDGEIISKIKSAAKSDAKLQKLWVRMDGKVRITQTPPFTHTIKCKSRKVDPLVAVGDDFTRVSELFADWKRDLPQESKPKIWNYTLSD